MGLSITILVLSGCEFKDIQLKEVSSVDVESLQGGNIKGTIHLVIENPNGFPVTIKSAKFDVLSGAVKLGEAKLDEPFRINANISESYPIRLSGNMGNALSGGIVGLMGLLAGKNPEVTLKGELKASSFFVSKTVPVELKTELPISFK